METAGANTPVLSVLLCLKRIIWHSCGVSLDGGLARLLRLDLGQDFATIKQTIASHFNVALVSISFSVTSYGEKPVPTELDADTLPLARLEPRLVFYATSGSEELEQLNQRGLAAVLERASLDLGSASDFGRHSVESLPRLHCAFGVTRFGRLPFPPQLGHRAFLQFMQEFDGPLDPDYSLSPILADLSQCLADAARTDCDERTLTSSASDLLARLLGVPPASLGPRPVPGHRDSQCDLAYVSGPAAYPLLITVVKKKLDGDALCELGAYYAQMWADRPLACCPSFLLQWVGSYFAVVAAMATPDGIWIEEMTPFVGVMFYHNPASSLTLADSVPTPQLPAIGRPSSTIGNPIEQRFPFFFAPQLGLHINEQIAESLCFRAHQLVAEPMRHSEQRSIPVMVKVVFGHYGIEAHQILSDAGLAPALLACYELPSLRPLFLRAAPSPQPDYRHCGHHPHHKQLTPAIPDVAEATAATTRARAVLVIMEDIPDFRRWKTCTPEERRSLVPELSRAVRLLHGRTPPIVHGDLRSRNVGAIRDAGGLLHLKVVDFDWADRVLAARYPLDLNPGVAWPVEAPEGAPILTEHDNYWVGQLH
ncbi:hypothetical protein PAPYR_7917 [Paratrimastix pyriformis]|uniref:Aminoglycoside phosphotransferase domain-containing protein n=1 Tax=Paratrimastix pyriformis TaxID=342808 RepID=A0ABQ8UEI4_9EUKA|nr:hypothetical protein PAPYR_7917 [Paratrimastix pyriformis]